MAVLRRYCRPQSRQPSPVTTLLPNRSPSSPNLAPGDTTCDSNRGFTNMEAHHSHHSHSRASPTEAASSFCNAFSAKKPPSSILKHFSSTHADDIIAYEHGLPKLAPFLGRSFSGLDGVRSCFDLVGECVTYSNMRFSNFVVDPYMSQVSVRVRPSLRGEAQVRDGTKCSPTCSPSTSISKCGGTKYGQIRGRLTLRGKDYLGSNLVLWEIKQ
ncbi:hypothetical protein B0T14DRAFT_516403 [Immersiella caudata]|uniref:Uncharacterized protein n=1 Tax=Immersiella caudata TaxID=314043 RepID=A0AA39WXK9_9PEZI|nr:hypothetical protein B0T14DRAFT_516403 [Immersiella caudata]